MRLASIFFWLEDLQNISFHIVTQSHSPFYYGNKFIQFDPMQQCLKKKIIFLSVNINIYWNNIVSGNIATLNKNFMVVRKKTLEIQRIEMFFAERKKNLKKTEEWPTWIL